MVYNFTETRVHQL